MTVLNPSGFPLSLLIGCVNIFVFTLLLKITFPTISKVNSVQSCIFRKLQGIFSGFLLYFIIAIFILLWKAYKRVIQLFHIPIHLLLKKTTFKAR